MPMEQTEKMQQGLANVRQAAAHLGLSVAKVYQLMGQGELPYVKIGKSRRIPWKALDELVQRCTVQA
jgi:excisionase family DNA binding protein